MKRWFHGDNRAQEWEDRCSHPACWMVYRYGGELYAFQEEIAHLVPEERWPSIDTWGVVLSLPSPGT